MPNTDTADFQLALVDGVEPSTADVLVSTMLVAVEMRATTRLLVFVCADVAPPAVAS